MQSPDEETDIWAHSPGLAPETSTAHPTGIMPDPHKFNHSITLLLQYIQSKIENKWANGWLSDCCMELSKFENELYTMEDDLAKKKDGLDYKLMLENTESFRIAYEGLRDRLLIDTDQLQDSSLSPEERKVFSATLESLQKFADNMAPVLVSVELKVKSQISAQDATKSKKEGLLHTGEGIHHDPPSTGKEAAHPQPPSDKNDSRTRNSFQSEDQRHQTHSGVRKETLAATSTPGLDKHPTTPLNLGFSPSPIPLIYPSLPPSLFSMGRDSERLTPPIVSQSPSQSADKSGSQETQDDYQDTGDEMMAGWGKLRDYLRREISNTREERLGSRILQTSLEEQTRTLTELREKHRETSNRKEELEREYGRLREESKKIEVALDQEEREKAERRLLLEDVQLRREHAEQVYKSEMQRLRESEMRASAARKLAEEAKIKEIKDKQESEAIMQDIQEQRELRIGARYNFLRKESSEGGMYDYRPRDHDVTGTASYGHKDYNDKHPLGDKLRDKGKRVTWGSLEPQTSPLSGQWTPDRFGPSYGSREQIFPQLPGQGKDAQSLLQCILKEVKLTTNDPIFEKELFTLGCEMVGAVQQFKGLTKSCREAQGQSTRNLQHTCQTELKKSKVTMLISEKRNVQVRFTNCHLLKPLSRLALDLTEKLRAVFDEAVTELENEISKLHNLFLDKGLSEPLIKSDQLDALMPMATFDGDSCVPHLFTFKKRVTIYLDNSQIIQDFRGQKILAFLSGGALKAVKSALGSSSGPISEDRIWSILEPLYGNRHDIYRFIYNRHLQKGRIPNDTDHTLYAEACETATFHLEEIESMIVLGDATGREHSVLCTEYLNLLANNVLPSRLNLHDEANMYGTFTNEQKFDFILNTLRNICKNTRRGQADSRNNMFSSSSLLSKIQLQNENKVQPPPTTMQAFQTQDGAIQGANNHNTGMGSQPPNRPMYQGTPTHFMQDSVIPWHHSQPPSSPSPHPATCRFGGRIVGIQGLRTLSNETIQAEGLNYMFVEGVCDICCPRGSKDFKISKHLVTLSRRTERPYLDRDTCPDLLQAGSMENKLKLLAERSVCPVCLTNYCRSKNACDLFKMFPLNQRKCRAASCTFRLTLCQSHINENAQAKEELTNRLNKCNISCTFLNFRVQFTESMKTCATLVSQACKEAKVENIYLYQDENELRKNLDGSVTEEQVTGDPVYLLFNLEGAQDRVPQPVLFDSGSMLTLVFGKTLGNQIRAVSLKEENVNIQGLVSNTTAVPHLGMLPLQKGSYLSVKCYSIERNIRVPGVDTKNILQFIKDNDPNGDQVSHIEVDDWSGDENGSLEINALIGINQLSIYPKKIFEAECGISIFEVPLRAGKNCSQYCLGGSFRDLGNSSLLGTETPTLVSIPPSISWEGRDQKRPNYFIGLRFHRDNNFSRVMEIQSKILEKHPNLDELAIDHDRIHFTILAFHADEENIEEARTAFNEAIAELRSRGGIELKISGLDSFPEGAIFLKVGERNLFLKQLRNTFAKQLSSRGFHFDQRFTPHITLVKAAKGAENKSPVDLTGIEMQLGRIKVSELGLYYMRKPFSQDGFYRSMATLSTSEKPIITVEDPDQDRLDDAANNNTEDRSEGGARNSEPVQEPLDQSSDYEEVTLDHQGNAINQEGRILVSHTLLALEEEAPNINIFDKEESEQNAEVEENWGRIAKDIWSAFDSMKKPPFSPPFGRIKPINFKGIFSPENSTEKEPPQLSQIQPEGPAALPASTPISGEVPIATDIDIMQTNNQLQRDLHVDGDILKSLIRLQRDSSELLPTRCPKHINCKECSHPDWIKTAKTLRGAIENQIIESSVQVLPEQNLILCRLPLCENYTEILESSREVCVKRLRNALKKTPESDKEPIRKSWQKLTDKTFIRALKDLSPVEKRIVEESPKQAYIPTTFVWKGESITSPGRVTFDATSRTVTNKAALNDCLLAGETSITVFSIISIWRLFRFALTADISNFFCCFKLSADQWGLQRVVWIPSMDANDDAEDFLITTLIFGFRSVTAQTSAGIRKLVELHPELEPILKHLYVDDLGNSFQNQEEALAALDVATKILGNYGLHFKDGGAISGLPPPEKMSKDGIHVSVPGHYWNTIQDTYRLVFPTIFSGRKIKGRLISVKILQNFPSEDEMYKFFKETGFTLRVLLSRIASIYCPGGLFSALLATLRGLMRESMDIAKIDGTNKPDWDKPLGDEILSRFTKTLKEVERLTHWNYPRCTLPYNKEITKRLGLLIIAADAADLEGVSAYISFPLEDGTWSMSMVGLKSFLSKRSHTTPKRELSSMSRGAAVKDEIMKHLGHLVERSILLNDSMTSLFWVLNTEGVLSVFHRNRVSIIREAFQEEDIFYVPSATNIADDLTRFNATAETTSPGSRLFLGPDFLRNGLDFAVKNGDIIPLKGLKENLKNMKEKVRLSDVEEGFLLMPNKTVTLSALRQLKDSSCNFSQAISSTSNQSHSTEPQTSFFSIAEKTKGHLEASTFILNPLRYNLGKAVRIAALAILFLKRTISRVAERKDTVRWGEINNVTKNLKTKDLDRYFSLHICSEMTEQSWDGSKDDVTRDTVERRANNLKCEMIREDGTPEVKARMDELQKSIIKVELKAARAMLDGVKEPEEQKELLTQAEDERNELLIKTGKQATTLTSIPTPPSATHRITDSRVNLHGWGSYPGISHYRDIVSNITKICAKKKLPNISQEEARKLFTSVSDFALWLHSLQTSKKSEIQELGNFLLPDLGSLLQEMETSGLSVKIHTQMEEDGLPETLTKWERLCKLDTIQERHVTHTVPLPGSLSKQAQTFKVYRNLEEMKDLVQAALSHFVLASQEEMQATMGEGWVNQHGYMLGGLIFSSNRGRQAMLQWTEDSNQMGLIQPYQLLFEKSQPLYLALVKYIHEIAGFRTTQRRVETLRIHHPGITATHTLVLRLAYAPGGLQAITKMIKSCLPCISRLRQRVYRQFGRLHKESFSVLYPFFCTHFDCLGPIRIKRLRGTNISTRQSDAYVTTAQIMIFVCSWSKAVHAELIEDSSAVEMSNGMTRFMCKVGMARSLIMDRHATNLLLANEGELLVQIQTSLMKRTGWTFQAVAKGNHHENGQVERRARSYREILGSADCTRTGISFNQYQTLVDVCSCLINQVPLGTTLKNPTDPNLAVVAPIDFLNSQRRGMGTLSSPIHIPKSPAEQFHAQQQHFQRMRTMFIENVIPSILMPQRERSAEGQMPLNIGDLVIFAENPSSFLPGWSLGTVQGIARSSEGVDREVVIKYCKDQSLGKSTFQGEDLGAENEHLSHMGATDELKTVKTSYSQRTSKEIIKLLPLEDDFSQAISDLSLI